jgi:hypothetical protein
VNTIKNKMARSVSVSLVVVVAGACAPERSIPAANGHQDVHSAPSTDTQLSARLLAAGDLADAAWRVVAFPGSSAPSDASAGTGSSTTPAFDCPEMIDGITFLRSAGTPTGFASEAVGAAGGGATTAGTIDPAGIQGTEMLSSYAGDGARQAMAKVRGLVAECSGHQDGTDMTVAFSLATAPALGDESLVVRASESLGDVARFVSDALIVCSGSTILVLNALPTTEHNATIMTSLGATAVKKLSAA